MKNPGSLVFTVANFDMTDELGRHFTYADQIARDRTGGIFIDHGDGDVQSYLIATSLQNDPDHIGGGDLRRWLQQQRLPIGIPLDFALQHVLGWKKNASTHRRHHQHRSADIQPRPRRRHPGNPGQHHGCALGQHRHLGRAERRARFDADRQRYGGRHDGLRNTGQRWRRAARPSRQPAQRRPEPQWVVGTTEDRPASADFGTLHADARPELLSRLRPGPRSGRPVCARGDARWIDGQRRRHLRQLVLRLDRQSPSTDPSLRDPIATPDGIRPTQRTPTTTAWATTPRCGSAGRFRPTAAP